MKKSKLLQLPHTSVLTDLRIEIEQSGRGHSWIPGESIAINRAFFSLLRILGHPKEGPFA
jgi:hypothetical protein